MRRCLTLCLVGPLALAACGASPARRANFPAPRCPESQFWNGEGCISSTANQKRLETGAAALADFRMREALGIFRAIERSGPHPHSLLVRLYEQIGIAHGFLQEQGPSISAFGKLLGLAPNHILSYELGPKATGPFQQARNTAKKEKPPTIDVSWPRKLKVSQGVPLEVEVIADPKKTLRRAVVHVRKRGDQRFGQESLELKQSGSFSKLTLPALKSSRPEVLELYVTAFDDQGNEVLRWSSPTSPREISLSYTAPQRWYQKWWIWAAGGTAVAAAVGVATFFILQDPPDNVPVDVN